MMDLKDVLVEVNDGLAKVTLNRPQALNAFSADMREGLATAFEGFARDDTVRAVLLTGAGRAFCAGGDIKAWGDMSDRNKFDAGSKLVCRVALAITSLPKPVVAMVNGDAMGGGCNMALACDMIVAAENARFGQTFIKLGLLPDWGGTYFLPRLVGVARARELMFTGKLISAREAERIGLINLVVPGEKLEEEATALARQLARSPTAAIAAAKRLVNEGWLTDLPTAMDKEFRGQFELFQSEDFREGKSAFIEKRKPVFKGK